MSHDNEIATVTLRSGAREGVVYSVDPEDGWVTVVSQNEAGEKRLMIVRPELVKYSGRKSETAAVLPEMVANSNVELEGAQLLSEFKKRGVDGTLDGTKVVLLDGLVTISVPYEPENIETTNSTIQNRLSKVLAEIREEVRKS